MEKKLGFLCYVKSPKGALMMTRFLSRCICSDGAGRSGVYLAIDANIELSEEDGVFDVYGYLVKMRQQRRGLVETLVSVCEKTLF